MVDSDVGGEVFLEALGKGADVDVDLLGSGGLFGVGLSGRIGEKGLGEFFGSADGEFTADDLICSEFLDLGIFDGEDGFGVADGDLALGEMDLDIGVEIEQAHGVCHRSAGFADTSGDLFLFQQGERFRRMDLFQDMLV